MQINLQHSKAATYNLTRITVEEEPDLILIQEPYEYLNRPSGIEKKQRIFTAGTGKHRAAIIVVNSKIDAILITKLSDEDTVVLEIVHNNLKFYATSMNFDITDQIENNFSKMDEILKFSKGEKILIAADTNSRSKTWHDVITNPRGRKLEEYLASNQLHILNEESESHTFQNSRCSSNIDLSITNNKLLSSVHEWEISSEESLSDHNYLKYKIGAGRHKSHYNGSKLQDIKYIIKEEKLHAFDRNLVQEMRKMTCNEITKEGAEEIDMLLAVRIAKENDLEKNIDLFEETVQVACKRTFQINTTRKKNSKKKSVPWWTDSLTVTRKRVNACRRLYQRTRNDEVLRGKRKETYLKAKSAYQADIKKGNINSWKQFCNVEASTNPWSQVYKLAAGKARPNSIMSTIRKPDGTETANIQETINVMLDHFFTEDREEDNSRHKNIRKAIEEPINTSEDLEFSREEVKRTIESFNPKKAPGLDGITGGIYQRTFHLFPRVITTM